MISDGEGNNERNLNEATSNIFLNDIWYFDDDKNRKRNECFLSYSYLFFS